MLLSIIRKTLLTLLLSIFTATAYLTSQIAIAEQAKSSLVFTTTIVCAGEVNCLRGLQAAKVARAFYQETFGIDLKIQKVERIGADVPGYFFERLQGWVQIINALGLGKTDLVLVFVEPFPGSVDAFDFKQEETIGIASGIGDLGTKPAGCFVKVMGSERFLTKVTIHEIGHLLGAEHIPEGIMHPSASLAQFATDLSPKSKEAIWKHLAKVEQLRSEKKNKTDKE